MNREQLKAMGIADEHFDSLLDAFHAEQNDLLSRNKRAVSKQKNKASVVFCKRL